MTAEACCCLPIGEDPLGEVSPLLQPGDLALEPRDLLFQRADALGIRGGDLSRDLASPPAAPPPRPDSLGDRLTDGRPEDPLEHRGPHDEGPQTPDQADHPVRIEGQARRHQRWWHSLKHAGTPRRLSSLPDTLSARRSEPVPFALLGQQPFGKIHALRQFRHLVAQLIERCQNLLPPLNLSIGSLGTAAHLLGVRLSQGGQGDHPHKEAPHCHDRKHERECAFHNQCGGASRSTSRCLASSRSAKSNRSAMSPICCRSSCSSPSISSRNAKRSSLAFDSEAAGRVRIRSANARTTGKASSNPPPDRTSARISSGLIIRHAGGARRSAPRCLASSRSAKSIRSCSSVTSWRSCWSSSRTASPSCGSCAAGRCSPAMRLAIAAASGRTTQNPPPRMKKASAASGPFIGSCSRTDTLGVAPLGEQSLGEIQPFGQFADFMAQRLQIFAQRLAMLRQLSPKAVRARRPSADSVADRPADRRERDRDRRSAAEDEDQREDVFHQGAAPGRSRSAKSRRAGPPVGGRAGASKAFPTGPRSTTTVPTVSETMLIVIAGAQNDASIRPCPPCATCCFSPRPATPCAGTGR